MKIHNIQQGSDEWYAIRRLKLTASNATAIANQGKGLETLVNNLILEAISPQERYTNDDIERGNELETFARTVYEFENNVTVKQVGFVEYSPFSGCSPDGLVGDDGLIEIKARNDKKHLELLLTDKLDSDVIWQMNMQMLCTGRYWCDFISYNPNFKQALYVQRVDVDIDKQADLIDGIQKGTEMLKDLLANDVIKNELT